MKYIVYKTTNLINNYIYIGVHKTATPYDFDHYLGNGVYDNISSSYQKAKTKFQQAVKEFGPNNFRRETLAVYSTAMEAYSVEELLVNEEFLSRSDVYNMILGGIVNCTEGINVYQYDINGNLTTSYDSFESAGRTIGVQASSIRRAVLYKYKVKNTYFNTDKVEKLDLSNYTINIKKVKVYRYTKDGKFDQEFDSYGAAARNSDSSPSNIRNATILGYCARGLYYFSFIKAEQFDRARTKQIQFRKVHQYTADGVYITTYETQAEAERQNPYSNITKAIKLKSVDENGFMWALEHLDKYNCPIPRNRKKRVGLYSETGELLKTWDSARQCAAEVGGTVQNVLKGKYKKHKGAIYKYLDS